MTTRIKPFYALGLIWTIIVIFVGQISIGGISLAVPALYILFLLGFLSGVFKKEEITRTIQILLLFLMMFWVYLLAGQIMDAYPLYPEAIASSAYPTSLLLMHYAVEIMLPMATMVPLIYFAFESTTAVAFAAAMPTIIFLNSFNFENKYAIGLSVIVLMTRLVMVSLVALFVIALPTRRRPVLFQGK